MDDKFELKRLPQTPEERERLLDHFRQLGAATEQEAAKETARQALRQAKHVEGPGKEFLDGLTEDMEQTYIEEAHITVDPMLGFEIRSAFFTKGLFVVATARADGFVEAIVFDAKNACNQVGTADYPVHLTSFAGELRARYRRPGS